METENIFLDTSVFIKNAYAKTKKLSQLKKFAKKKKVKIFTSYIVIEEIRQNINKELISAKDIVNDCHKKLNGKARILKFVDRFESYFALPIVDISLDYQNIIQDIDDFVRLVKPEYIDPDLSSVSSVFKKYFNSEPPFEKGDKKNEFPDAFILSSIEKWCLNNNEKMILLTEDEGMSKYNSPNIITNLKLTDVLDKIYREIKQRSDVNIEKIDLLFKENQERLLDELKSDFEREYSSHFYITIDELIVTAINIDPYKIISLNDKESVIESTVKVDFDANIEYDDYSHAYYDKEDNVWYNQERKNTSFNSEVKFPVQFKVELMPPAGEDFASIEIHEIDFPDDSFLTDELPGYR